MTQKLQKHLKTNKSAEIIYGLRNFIGNANKYSKNKIEVFLSSNNKDTEIIIRDDGPGFPKDLIEKDKLGEPYIRTTNPAHISKYGLGLALYRENSFGKKLCKYIFNNSKKTGGAEVIIKWKNKDLIQV